MINKRYIQSVETLLRGITRTPEYISPGLGALPSPTKPHCELRVSEPDHTTKLGRASQMVEIMKGHKVFEIDFAIFQ